MVAIFTGAGVGIERGSAATLGKSGLLGQATFGRGNDQVYVNAASGNLMVDRQDEVLIGRGPDETFSLTYNSQANPSFPWQEGARRVLHSLTGTVNTAGSTVRRVDRDGRNARYTFDAAANAYLNKDGGGAHDVVRYVNGAWSWSDGDSGFTETYTTLAASPGFNFVATVTDRDGNVQTYSYDAGGSLSRITNANGDYTDFTISGGKPIAATTYYTNAQGSIASLTRVRYSWDAQGRLSSATVDLTPEDHSTADGKSLTTTYTYDGTSTRVTSIAQSDGSRLDVTYETFGTASYWVRTVTQTVASGNSRTTSFWYDIANRVTTVTDALGGATTLHYDAASQLTKIVAPAPVAGAAQQIVQFAYTANGDVASRTDPQGNVTSFTYDAMGNVLTQTDSLGAVITRTYGSRNELLTETRSGANAASPDAQHTTRFAYDSENHLRYSVSAEGLVTEYRYTAAGQVEYTIEYPEHFYDVSGLAPSTALAEWQLDGWRNGIGDKSSTKITYNTYDARGNLATTTRYGIATAAGAASTAEGYSRSVYTYSHTGQLLSRYEDGQLAESFVYDGLGRVTGSTDLNGGTTSIVYNDAATQTIVTMANGFVTTSTYNKAGELISRTESGSYVAGGTSTQKYDKLGRLRMSTDATGVNLYHLYDKSGRRVADIAHNGQLTEYRYDGNNRLIATMRYMNAVNSGYFGLLGDPDSGIELGTVRPGYHPEDVCTWTFYDKEGRVSAVVDGSGAVQSFGYDKSGRLISTTAHFNKLASWQTHSFKNDTPLSVGLPPADGARDRISRNFYDKAGRQIASLDGEGFLTRSLYDKAGQLVEQIAYLNPTNAGYRATGTLDQLVATQPTHSDDRRTRFVYDGQGLLRFQVDGLNQVTGYSYDAARQVTSTVRYAGTLPGTGDYTYDNVKALVANYGLGAPASTRRTWAVYDNAGRLVFSIDADDAVTRFSYDNMGQVTKATQYANRRSGTTSLPSKGDMDAWASGQDGVAANRVTRNYYTARGEIRFTVDAEGFVSRTDFDAAGRTTREVRWDSAIGGVHDGTTIDNINNAAVGTWTDTNYGYDASGTLVEVRNGENNTVRYAYNANGSLASEGVVESDQSWTTYTYDGAGRVLSQNQAGLATTSYEYDGHGNVVRAVDPRGQATVRTFDRLGRVRTETDALGGVVSYEYNAFGEAVKATDARGNASFNYYNKLGQVTASRDAEGFVTETAYSVFGDVTAITRRYNRAYNAASVWERPAYSAHAKDATTSFEYDRLGRVVKTTDAEGHFEQYTLDAYGNRVSVRNKLGGTVTNAFDRRGLLVAETLPMASHDNWGNVTAWSVTNRFEYDARGNRTRHIEADGLAEKRTTVYVYDKANRLIETRGDAVSGGTPTERIKYDQRGRVIETQDALGARTLFYYDKLNRKTAEIAQTGASTGTMSTYGYDQNGNLLSSTVWGTSVGLPATAGGGAPGAPGGEYRQTTYSYDALNRLKSSSVANVRTGAWNGSWYATGVATVTSSYDYDANGNVVKTTDGNGAAIHSFFDKAGRKIAHVDQENFLTSYTLDAEGNVTLEERFAAKLSVGVGTGSDPAYLRATVAGAGPDRKTEFVYDRNGRRTSETRLNVGSHVTYGSNSLHAGASHSTIQYAYNGMGEVTQKTFGNGDVVNYSYDSSGRLTQESRAGFTDHSGTWVRPTTHYYYNGINNLMLSRQGGQSTAGGDRLTRYTYGAGGRMSVMLDANGDAYYYSYDVAGNVSMETYDRRKSDGSIVSEGISYSRDIRGRVVSQGLIQWQGYWANGDRQETAYNAYGDVAQRGVNGGWQEQFAYDGAGRMWRSNSGDGVWRFFIHDANGNQTLTLESEGSNLAGMSIDQALATATANGAYHVGGAYIDGINATINVVDRRGQAVQTRLPKRQTSDTSGAADITVSRTYTAFGEVASETDARGYTTDFTYNSMGRLTQKQGAAVEYTNENGSVGWARPTEIYSYDAAGRMIATRDANGNLTTRALLAGTGHDGSEAIVTHEFHADGGFVRNDYDMFGDKRISWDEIGRRSEMAYDALGRMTQLTKPNGLVEYFGYDLLGQRTKHWNSHLGSYNVETTDYDLQGRVVRQVAFGGDVTTTSYAWNGGIATAGMGTFGGWTETTTVANGRSSTEQTDLFGRQVYKSDLGGRVFNYSYDLAGRLTQRTGGEAVNYTYLNTGKVSQVFSQTGDVGSSNWSRKGTTYGYDSAGNLTSERMTEEGEEMYWYWNQWDQAYEPVYNSWSRTYKNATATYDAAGRMVTWAEAGSADMANASTSHKYDLAGNIRRTHAIYRPLDNAGNQVSYTYEQDNWYRFDSMNRMVTKGEFDAYTGQIVRGSNGADFMYDKAGQRVSSMRTSQGEAWVYNPYYYYDPYDPYSGGDEYMLVYYDAETREDYSYDAGGALTSVRIAQGSYTDNGDGTVTPEAAPAYGQLRASYTNDLMGRVTQQVDWLYDGSNAAYDRTVWYNEKGQVYYETVVQKQGYDTLTTYTSNDFGSGSGYALGAVVYSSASHYKLVNGYNSYQNGSNTTTTYAYFDGAVQSQISHRPNTSQSTTYTTNFGYDSNGALGSVSVSDGRSRTISFVNDANGQAIKRSEADYVNGGDPNEIWHRFGGKQMGAVGNNGTLDTDYATSISNRTRTPGTGAFRFGSTWGGMHADFDLSGEAITSYSQGVSAGGYTVRQGDSLESIAANLWGDSTLWYKLAEANGLSGANGLTEGQRLIVPGGVMKNHHNAGTFKPFDPSETLGDINPTAPKAQKGKRGGNKCGVMGQILLVAIAVAVSAITYGALTGPATGLLGAIGAGAVSGAAGSIASQGFGVATGIQDKFSWKAVGMAAVGGAVGGGLGKVGGFLGADKFLSNVARGALSSAMTQGIGVATGLQKKFDWVGVAAAGLGAGVAGEAARRLGISPTAMRTGLPRDAAFYVNQTISGMAGAIANAATRSVLQGTGFGDNLLAALPDVIGTTIGNMVADPVTAGIAEAKQKHAARAAFREIAMTPEGQATLRLIGITDRTPTARDLLNYLRFNPQGLGVREATELFGRNIEAWVRHAGRQAADGGADFTDVVMAQNRALRIFYAAVATEMPHFQWTGVGGVVAGQVGGELQRMGTILRGLENATGTIGDAILDILPGGDIIGGGTEVGKASLRDIMGKLIQGQIDVVTDIGKYALAYEAFGATAVSRSASNSNVREAFRLQALSDSARANGNLRAAASFGREAAYNLGVHEQQRLQGMWNDMQVQAAARGGSLVGMVNTDISTPVGIIRTPENLSGGPWDLNYRLGIARNAFNFMHDRVFSPAAGNAGSSRMDRYFNDIFTNGRLRFVEPPQPRRA